MNQHAPAYPAAQAIDRRIRHAMRILENEQTPLATTEDVAARVGLSLFHFVRLFEKQIGLSPQDYGRAVLLSCAASRLRYSDEPIAVVARDFGYARQSGFNKAFTRHHGIAPARWRRRAKAEVVPVPFDGVRLELLPARRCLARRYFGPREATAAQWADMLGRLPPEMRALPRVGFTYDDPRVTPPERIRHDPGIEVDDDFALPERLADDGFELLESPAGLWAMIDVLARDTAEGYRAINDGWFQSRPGYAMEGDPFLERNAVAPAGEVVVTVCVRVRPVEQDGAWNMAALPLDGAANATPEVSAKAQRRRRGPANGGGREGDGSDGVMPTERFTTDKAMIQAELERRARAEMAARMADPTLTIKALAGELGTSNTTLWRAFRDVGGVRAVLTAIRLDAALLALVPRPPVAGIVGDVARAHGMPGTTAFRDKFAARFGRMPSEVLAMRAVWPEARFRAWLEGQADRHGFRAALDGMRVERRPMMLPATAPQRRGVVAPPPGL